MKIFFDTETTGFTTNYIIQLAYIVEENNKIIEEKNLKFNLPDGVDIDEGASKVHGVYKKDLEGFPLIKEDLVKFVELLIKSEEIICHNASFDMRMIKTECERNGIIFPEGETQSKVTCTMNVSTNLCRIPQKTRAGYKFPKLTELHQFLFNEEFDNAHDALGDIRATIRCYNELKNKYNI